MQGMNLVVLCGRLGKDPELNETSSGVPYCKFSMATGGKWTDKEGTERDNTQWHNIVVWRGQGEACAKFLKKGSQVTLRGSIEYSTYEKDGETKYFTQIVADPFGGVQFGPKQNGDGGGQRSTPPPPTEPPGYAQDDDGSDDNIPF